MCRVAKRHEATRIFDAKQSTLSLLIFLVSFFASRQNNEMTVRHKDYEVKLSIKKEKFPAFAIK